MGGGRQTEHRVIVTGLPPSASWQDLKDHMRKAGDVVYTDVDHRGGGIVHYGTSSNGADCMAKRSANAQSRVHVFLWTTWSTLCASWMSQSSGTPSTGATSECCPTEAQGRTAETAAAGPAHHLVVAAEAAAGEASATAAPAL
eukprot:715-Heterococcus_DN1.PRE.1